ncbi:ArsB/NhaD superfamily permease [Candidatus Gastranaerophilus sp. (ex Termes propinquus)]|nr:ArsB/NhaD superfamily permease [Candidatus Gastranaerophilus sp. (ex Termes propinquus)]
MDDLRQIMAHWQTIAAAVIFLASYAFIISEKINRSTVAVSGAVLLILLGIVDLHTAYTVHIHWETIFLLLGMMIIVGITSKSGFFQYIAIKAAQSAKGDPVKIMTRLAVLTAFGSAFVDSVTMVLLMVPVTIAICRTLNLNPVPFLIVEIIMCNIGGTATLVGDPPNIMIGTVAGLSFNDFLLHLTPIILLIAFLTLAYLKFHYAKYLKISEECKLKLMDIDATDCISDVALAKRSLFVFALTLLGFLTHQLFNLEPATIALAGATLLMLLGAKKVEAEEVFHSIEWVTIFFFAGLFILVGALVDVGIIGKLAKWMIDITGGSHTAMSFTMLWGAGVASSFIDNIPLVATTIPLVQDISVQLNLTSTELNTVWWALSLGACLGGNGTLIASAANMVVACTAAREGAPISFVEFIKIGIPITLVTLVLATLYVWIVFVVLGFVK